jgi:glycine cleavage system H protein
MVGRVQLQMFANEDTTMSIILALTTVLILIAADQLRRSAKGTPEMQPVIVKRYHHLGHTWVRETADGDVLVGIDDFAQSLIGQIDGLDLPRILKKVNQGGLAFQIHHGKRIVPIVSPVSGRVIEKNEMVLNQPWLVNTAPYGDGWILRIRPNRLSQQLNNLLTGKPASQWLDSMKPRLASLFSATPALMYQDGGMLMNDLADRCSDAEWNRLVETFFLNTANDSH